MLPMALAKRGSDVRLLQPKPRRRKGLSLDGYSRCQTLRPNVQDLEVLDFGGNFSVPLLIHLIYSYIHLYSLCILVAFLTNRLQPLAPLQAAYSSLVRGQKRHPKVNSIPCLRHRRVGGGQLPGSFGRKNSATFQELGDFRRDHPCDTVGTRKTHISYTLYIYKYVYINK